MPKRQSIKGLGADAFFTPPETEQATVEAPAQEVNQLDIKPVEQQDSTPVNHEPGKAANQPLVKATFYLSTEHMVRLEEVRLHIMRTTGTRKDKSELVREAIDLLSKQYTS